MPSQPDPDYVLQRITDLVARHQVLSPLELQVRLGEYGRPSSRIRPRTTRWLLKRFSRRRALPFGLMHVRGERMLTLPGRSSCDEALETELDAKITATRAARRLSPGWLARRVSPFLAEWLGSVTAILPVEQPELLAVPRDSSRLLIYCDVGWLYPDDQVLWKHLVACAHARVVPLVLARYVDPATFGLLKFVGGLAHPTFAVPLNGQCPELQHLSAIGLRTEEPCQWLPRFQRWWKGVLPRQLGPTLERINSHRQTILAQGARSGLAAQPMSYARRQRQLDEFLSTAGMEPRSRESILAALP